MRAEVVVQLGETIVTLAHVAPDARFVIGTTRDADAAIDVPVPFAVVEGTPRGFLTRAAADATPTPLVSATALRITPHVTIRVTPVPFAPEALPLREADRRALAFGALSLSAHLTLLGVATWFATPAATAVGVEETHARPTHVARVATAAQTVERAPAPPPATLPITTDDTPTPTPMIDDFAIATRDAIAKFEENGLGEATAAPATESDASVDNGEPRTFDPDANPAFDTVKVGAYATLATGTVAGAHYKLAGENGQRRPVIVISCDAASCLVLGGDPRSGIREALEARLDQITGCYAQHAQTAGKKVELDFGIDAAGKIDAVNVGGVGDYDACVANIIASIELAPEA